MPHVIVKIWPGKSEAQKQELAEAITRVAGSSRWFGQGWVTYSNAAKTSALGVPAFTLKRYGAVSMSVVRYMALGARERAGADWAVAVSGVAGPDGGTDDKPVGTVWIDLSRDTYGIHGSPDPSKIGKTASNGCVRLTNWDAEQLAAGVKPGVVVRFI